LQFHGSIAQLTEQLAFQRLLQSCRRLEWVVFAKPPFAGANAVLDYLARYTHRIAISDHRLTGMQNGKVTFAYKDYKTGRPNKTMILDVHEFIRRFLLHVLPSRFQRIRYYILDVHEFIRRFLLHVLPSRFQRIRYYGFLANCQRADKRLVVGFIEPHFFAGFSGGAKGIVPGVAGVDTILHLHNYDLIAHPHSTWGEFENNPIQREIAEMVAHCPPDFLVNVTLNSDKEISALFAGDYREAHKRGCERAKSTSMTPVPNRFPIVVTSNSGFPLDQNLYQTVKGISVAERIVEDGGDILVASECSDGIPNHGNFGSILQKADTPEAVDDWIRNLNDMMLDQWQAQILTGILKRASVAIYSALDSDSVEAAMLVPVEDLQTHLEECIRRAGGTRGCSA